MSASQIDKLTDILSKIPGMGPRSARRAVLHLLKKREKTLIPLMESLANVNASMHVCSQCGNIDDQEICRICQDVTRDQSIICVVEDVADLWAIERTHSYKGLYHVLGGVLSAIDGVGPDELNIHKLTQRTTNVIEVIIATNATLEGQTTAHYIKDTVINRNNTIKISRLAHGVPLGGEIDYLDSGTLTTALEARQAL